MVNGGGFNFANASFPTDLTTDSNTANTASPVVSSATYNFVAGDVGHWVFVKSGTNWFPNSWYQIASVAANKATLSAAIGAGVIIDTTTNRSRPTTVIGCASVGTPTGGTYGVDYSQATAAIVNGLTDFNAVGASTTLTSATAGFTPVMVGNMFHQTTTGTGAFGVVGWYEIATYVNATTVTLDRTPNSGTASVNTTGYVGGALGLNSTLDDAWTEVLIGGNFAYIKLGSYTFGQAVAVAATSATFTNPIFFEGFNAVRGDAPTGANRPSINQAANAVTLASYMMLANLITTGTPSNGINTGIGTMIRNCKGTNTATGLARIAYSMQTGGSVINCEIVSQLGPAITTTTNRVLVEGCYIHDSDIGINGTGASLIAVNNIIEGCRTNGIALTNTATGAAYIGNNTIYGAEGKIGVGILINVSVPNSTFINNIFYGLTTGISQTTTQSMAIMGGYNSFFNNTTNATNYNLDSTDLTTNPGFIGATQITGSTATTSGSVLTQSGGDFSTVTNNVDYVRVVSGTGVTVGIYLITSHSGTTLTTNNALGTSSGGDVVYVVGTGHNFAIGTALKAAGFPGVFSGSETTGYIDIGGVQRQEASAGGSYTFS